MSGQGLRLVHAAAASGTWKEHLHSNNTSNVIQTCIILLTNFTSKFQHFQPERHVENNRFRQEPVGGSGFCSRKAGGIGNFRQDSLGKLVAVGVKTLVLQARMLRGATDARKRGSVICAGMCWVELLDYDSPMSNVGWRLVILILDCGHLTMSNVTKCSAERDSFNDWVPLGGQKTEWAGNGYIII